MEATRAEKDTAPRTAAQRRKYLTFSLDGEEYGVEIGKVREILGMMEITSVPQVPPYVQGVVNLRGKVVPVIDLRLRFGLEQAEYTEQTCIVVVDVGSPIGPIVDTVREVLDIDDDRIDPPPPLGAAVDASCVLGLAGIRDETKILLDVDKILGGC